MSTAFRCFAVLFTAAMAAVASFGFSSYSNGDFAPAILIFPAVFYFFFAGYTFVPDTTRWLKGALIILMMVSAGWQLFFLDLERKWPIAFTMLGAYIAAGWFLLYRSRDLPSSKTLSFTGYLLLVIGAVLVLASLFAVITWAPSGSARGWGVLARNAHWITYHVSPVQTPLNDTPAKLSPLYGTTGYAMYLAAVVAATATLGLVVSATIRRCHLCDLRWTTRVGGLSLLTTMWILVETFWGWRFELHESRTAAIFATSCWLAAIVSAAYLAFLVAHSSATKHQLQFYALFQLPLIVFSVPVWPVYFGGMFTEFPGICFLEAGLLLINLVYIGIVIPHEPVTSETSERLSPVPTSA